MENNNNKQSIVLSVSIAKGCYRHIKVSANDTLEDLADTILWAFDFCNDHAHAFFMDNHAWSDVDCYYMAEIIEDEDYRSTRDYKIGQIGLQRSNSFKFVFDFGDDWEFQCKVLRIINECTDEPEIIKRIGEPPMQYPDYEE